MIFCAQVPQGRIARRRAHGDARRRSTTSRTSPITKEEVDRARDAALKQTSSCAMNNSRARRASSSASGPAMGDWRLDLPATATALRTATAADVQRVALQYLKASNRTVGVFIPTAKPDRSVIPPHPSVAALVNELQGRRRVAGRRGVRSVAARTSTRAPRARAAERHEARAAAEEDARRRGATRRSRLHFGDERSSWTRDRVAGLTAAMLMRGTKKQDARADPGRARQAQGADRTSAAAAAASR